MRLIHYWAILCLGICAAPNISPAADALFDPPALYLQWQRDPTTTMTIHWHTVGQAKPELSFRPLGQTNWQTASGATKPFVGTERWVHIVELIKLTPQTDYEFCFGPAERFSSFARCPKI